MFGGGVGVNQNLALITESANAKSASGLGVALFSLASTLSRVGVGILSDRYAHVLSRYGWLCVVAALETVGLVLVGLMRVGTVLSGTFIVGVSFGAFFTVIVPVINEAFGKKAFGVIMGSQLASQALASSAISIGAIPYFYRIAKQAGQPDLCVGVDCFLYSFEGLASVNALGIVATVLLAWRNRKELPLQRYLRHIGQD